MISILVLYPLYLHKQLEVYAYYWALPIASGIGVSVEGNV